MGKAFFVAVSPLKENCVKTSKRLHETFSLTWKSQLDYFPFVTHQLISKNDFTLLRKAAKLSWNVKNSETFSLYRTDERKMKYKRINKWIHNLHSLYSILRAKIKYKIKHFFVHLNISLVSISGQCTQTFVTDFVLFCFQHTLWSKTL